MKKTLKPILFTVLIVGAFLLGLSIQRDDDDTSIATVGDTQASVWTCSMHPQIHLPDPGDCPICGMDLIALTMEDSGAGRSIQLSATARKLAEVEVTAVDRRTETATVRMVGKLEADETRIREISARVSGRIDRLYIDYTGVPVSAGQPLFDLYSPELYSAQQELIQAISTSHQLAKSGIESTRRSAERTVAAARERLRLWGLTDKQVRDIESQQAPTDHITFVAPTSGIVMHKAAVEGSYVKTGTHVYAIADLSVLWLKLDVYESDVAKIDIGHDVFFDTDTYPGERFVGTVEFIDPVVDERSRSVKVRVNVDNSDGRLKPGMFARATARTSVGDESAPPLIIPATAPLITGKRALVYVQDDSDPSRFHAREISLGARAGDFYVVHDGLRVGEKVVTNGAFKLDSALQILAGESMMHMGGGTYGTDESPQEKAKPVAGLAGQVDMLLAPYFALSYALSHDDAEAAKKTAGEFAVALTAVDANGLKEDARKTWHDAHDPLLAAATAMAAAETIDDARTHFLTASNHMIALIRAYGTTGKQPVFIYHCPMAFDNTGADWLQFTVGTENPYFGASMFKCGSMTETLVEAKDNAKAKAKE